MIRPSGRVSLGRSFFEKWRIFDRVGMVMEIRAINNQRPWDVFVQSQPDYTFLNAWAWGEFNGALGNKIWRLGLFDDGELVGVALVILVEARRGRFLFIPHPFIFALGENKGNPNFQIPNPKQFPNPKSQTTQTFLDYVEDIARKEYCSFIRVSPILLNTPENAALFQDLKFRPAPMHMHAETTWVLDIGSSQDLILRSMRKTTRYLIRRGEKEGVEVISGNDERLLQAFYELYQLTARRQHFTPFTYEYIVKELAAFGPDGGRVYLSTHNGKVHAGAIAVFYGDRAFYHHGASLHHPTASYVLQWRIIQNVKRLGLHEYNFWGVDFRPKHPWAGVTLFKTGFGGEARAYLSAYDLPLRFSYWFGWGIESARRVWRRY